MWSHCEARVTQPSRRLIDPDKPHRYTPSHSTDVRVTMEKFRRLIKRSQLRRALETL
jgi:hypothetical protein